jgi:hypothetical protein
VTRAQGHLATAQHCSVECCRCCMRVDSLLVAEAALDGLCCCQAGSGLPICISGLTKSETTQGIRPLGACCLAWGPDATLQVRGCRYKYKNLHRCKNTFPTRSAGSAACSQQLCCLTGS